jgi:putative FmdB family regulatory protein
MPTYEYACTACGERTEAKQSFDDPPLETCPLCEGKLRKLYSPVGIVFRGTGFYSTDGRKPDKAASGPSEKGDKTDKGSKTSDKGSGPSKSDAKATSSEST